MKQKLTKKAVSLLLSGTMLLSSVPGTVHAQESTPNIPSTITVDGGNKKFDSAPLLYGAFFEDINRAGDGGLYPEMIHNRSFESGTDDPWGKTPGSTALWSFAGDGSAELNDAKPMYSTNPHYLSVQVTGAGYTIYNSGYQGVPAKEGETYTFYMWVRNTDYSGEFKISIVDESGNALSDVATAQLSDETGAEGWSKYTATITCTATQNGRFALTMEGTGSFDVDFISLMPTDTWTGDDASNWPYGGLRKDLVQALADLEPKFIRFPGGCVVEGGFADGKYEDDAFDNRYEWKDTIGPLEQRQEKYNLWYAASPADDPYWQTYGLGYHEYFQLCEDLGAEPIPVVNCGISCQWRAPTVYLEPDSAEFQQEIQDALDLIEYANGSVDTEWGAKRAENGHPEPFNMKYLGIGNENWGEQFWENFAVFKAAIEEKYPDIEIIASACPNAASAEFDYSWEQAQQYGDEIIMDEHFYMTPDWFFTQEDRYADYDRDGAKVFPGEYSAQDGNSLYSAVAEAAFLTGLENNADIVTMSAYAPLFYKTDHAANWNSNMIWFDNFDVTYSANYYTQQLFATNYGDETLSVNVDAPEQESGECGSIVLASWNTQVEYDNVKLTDREGNVVFEDNFDDGSLNASWIVNGGTWTEEGGVLKQSGADTPAMIYLNADVLPEGFTGGTLTVDAKKTGGAEGFLIGYDFQDPNNYYWYNIGGWGNTADKVEKATNGTKTEVAATSADKYVKTELNQTYSFQIDFGSDSATLYKDGVERVSYNYGKEYLYSSATRDSESGDIYLKIVNGDGEAKKTAINVENLGWEIKSVEQTQMGSTNSRLVNTMSNPEAVVPVSKYLHPDTLKAFTVPAYSVTVLRISQTESSETPEEPEDPLDPPVTEEGGMQLYYRFDSASGNEVLDYSDNGYDTTIGGTINDDSWNEDGFAFNGTNYLKLTGKDLVSSNMSVVFRVKRTGAIEGPYSFFWGKNQSDYAGNGFWINSANENGIFVSTDTFNQNFYTVGLRREEFFPLNEWVEVAVTVDSATGEYAVYRNGVAMETEGAASVSITPPSASYNTIGMAGYDNEFINGLTMDKFMIYDKALSADEVREVYLDTFEDGNPNVWYSTNFDDGSDWVAYNDGAASFVVENGQARGIYGTKLELKDNDFTDFVYAADVCVTDAIGGGEFSGLTFRTSGSRNPLMEQNAYIFVIKADFDEVQLYRRVITEGTHVEDTMLLNQSYPLELGQTYRLKVEVEGESITAYIDDEKLGTFEDPGTPLTHGTVGFINNSQEAYYDNVTVGPIEGDEPVFVPVDSIRNVPTGVKIGGSVNLSGTVMPAYATNKDITWSIKDDGGTGAQLDGNTLTASAEGTAVVTATIANGLADGQDYTQDFKIAVSELYTVAVGGEKLFDASEDLYGLFFEDINHAGDGGLNPELINNRSFESGYNDVWNQECGSTGMWSFEGSGSETLNDANPMYETNVHYLTVDVTEPGYTMYNSGYKGVPAKEGQTYNFYMWVRNSDYEGDFQISIVDENGNALSNVATAQLSDETGAEGWSKYTATITCNATQNGRFALEMNGTGSFDVDFISLMPQDTWKGTDASKWPYGGLRKDLVQALADLEPSFLRFPGGCIVEGGWGYDNRYEWKDTIGPLEQRQEKYNLWYPSSPADDPYWQSYGVGFHEYFQLCEDLGAEPMPVVNCGMSCQGRGGEVFKPDTEEFKLEVQNALDLIEYANGSTDTEWGAKRAANGHPEPFNMKYLSIGNENWGPDFWVNFAAFKEEIQAVYPEIQIIASGCGGDVDGSGFQLAWEEANTKHPEVYLDEHFYMSPSWFFNQAHRYDDYDRDGAKIFAGEYAAHDSGIGALDRGGIANTLYSAVAEAAFLTGVERNADVVALAAYAPLFAKMDQTQWTPDMIWFDNFDVSLTPNYYVQQMFSTNYGDETLPVDLYGPEISMEESCGSIVLATWDTQVEYDNVKLVDTNGKVVFEDNFDDGVLNENWIINGGTWTEENGVLKQSGSDLPAMIYLNTDVLPEGFAGGTLTVDAKKTGGNEGFLIGYDFQDTSNYSWYNIGGWTNTKDVVEQAINGTKQTVATTSQDLFVATQLNEVYNIKIEFQGDGAKLYKNDVERMSYDYGQDYLYGSATRDSETGDVYLKLVNGEGYDKQINIDVTELGGEVLSIVRTELADPDRTIQNSIQHPDNIVPVVSEVDPAQLKEYTVPAYSVTVLQLKFTEGGEESERYTISVTQSEGGKITPDTVTVNEGSSKTFAITADEGYVVKDVLVDGISVGAVAVYTFQNVTEDHTITAIYEKADSVSYDLNGDQIVNLLDVVAAMKFYQEETGSNPDAQIADVNRDGRVTIDDLLLIVIHFTGV